MAGIRAGADCIHTTVNGLGERTGIPDLAETIVAFHNLDGVQKYNLEPLMNLSSYLEKVSGFFLAPNKPITGQNAFSHKSGVHTNGILKDPRTYDMASRILNEEIEHEAWFSEYLGEGPSGHFRRGEPGHAPYSKNHPFYIGS